jgi:hypothetical protein
LRLHHRASFGKSNPCRIGQSPSTDQQALSVASIQVNHSLSSVLKLRRMCSL